MARVETKNKEAKTKPKKKCFLITPIGGKDSIEYKKLCALEENVYKIVLDKIDYDLIIAHQIRETGSIGDQVFENILNADLIIANLTGLNANVMYETAVAHSFGIPTIMICEVDTKLPFDLISERTIFFDDSIEGCGYLIKELDDKIDHLLKDGNYANPVYKIIKRTAIKNESIKNGDEQAMTNQLLLDLQDQVTGLTRKINRGTARTYSRTNYNKYSSEDRYSMTFDIGKYGKLIIKDAGKYNSDRLNEVVRQFRDHTYRLNRFPTYAELVVDLDFPVDAVENFDYLELQN